MTERVLIGSKKNHWGGKPLKLWRLLALTSALLLLYITPALGEDFTIVTPYWGIEENTFVNEEFSLKLKDSQPIYGLFIQQINPEKYQWNLFLYRSENINYSDIQGLNFIYDHYFGVDTRNKKVVGLGLNYFQMDLSGENLPWGNRKLDGMEIDMQVFSPYVRVGKYYHFGEDKLRGSILPWVGGQWDITRGTGRVDLQGPMKGINFELDDDQFSWLAGLNLRMNIHHFIQMELKHSVAYHSGDFSDKSSVAVNFFLSRQVALSYRYSYLETAVGKDSYNMVGVAVVF